MNATHERPSAGAAALAGLLALVSPGAALAELEVRIAVVEAKAEVAIEAESPALFDAADGRRLGVGVGPVRWTARATKGGVGISGAVTWDDGARSPAALIVEAEAGIRVDRVLFLGRISVERAGSGLLVINRLPLETYLLGIVGSEMSPSWPPEALKAQAVAARTYALERRMMRRSAGHRFDLTADVLSQVYTGADRIVPSVIAAVESTRGEVLAFRHRPIQALFHSTCGGRTEPSRRVFGQDVPYLQSQVCPWCGASKHHRWTKTYELKAIERALAKRKLISGALRSVSRNDEGAPVVIEDARGRRAIAATELRAALGVFELPSHRFRVRAEKKKVVLSGQGFGHGVGMCQWGAKGLADERHGYREILTHYYAGAELRRLY